MDYQEDKWLPRHQPPDPVEELTIEHMWLFPGIAENLLEINFFLTVGTSLLFAHNTPATDAKFMEYMLTTQLVRVLNHTSLIFIHKQMISTNSTNILF